MTFAASFPPIQCIKYMGDGGARIVLDIPQSDEGAVELLRRWRDRVIMVTVVPLEHGHGVYEQDVRHEVDQDGESAAPRRRKAEGRKL